MLNKTQLLLVNFFRLPLWWATGLCSAEFKEDMAVWCKERNLAADVALGTLLRLPEFRFLVLFRLRKHYWLYTFLHWVYQPRILLWIHCPEVGAGCYIEHGFATIVSATKIGRNFRVNQQVTVGWRNGGCPAIGDNVSIGAGAKVLGNCHIGNDVKIGANCVVVKDVPDHCTVVGCPAYIVKRNGVKVWEKL